MDDWQTDGRTDSQENCVKHRQIFRADFPRGLSKSKEEV